MDDIKKDSGDPMGLSKEDLEILFQGAFEDTMNELPKIPSRPHFEGAKEASKTPHFKSSFEASKKEAFLKNFSNSQKQNLKPKAGFEKVKSSLRMKYEAEVEAIKKTSGDLEGIRRKLGLSKRKMAQLLLVDPSAWTRWTTRQGSGAPPHIFRALQWYLLLQEKHPQYKSSLWLNSVATPQLSAHEIENIKFHVIEKAQADLKVQARDFLDNSNFETLKLESELKKAKTESEKLNQRIQWLIGGQLALLLALFVLFLF